MFYTASPNASLSWLLFAEHKMVQGGILKRYTLNVVIARQLGRVRKKQRWFQVETGFWGRILREPVKSSGPYLALWASSLTVLVSESLMKTGSTMPPRSTPHLSLQSRPSTNKSRIDSQPSAFLSRSTPVHFHSRLPLAVCWGAEEDSLVLPSPGGTPSFSPVPIRCSSATPLPTDFDSALKRPMSSVVLNLWVATPKERRETECSHYYP